MFKHFEFLGASRNGNLYDVVGRLGILFALAILLNMVTEIYGNLQRCRLNKKNTGKTIEPQT